MPQQRLDRSRVAAFIAIGLFASQGVWAADQVTLPGFVPDPRAERIELVDQRPVDEKKKNMGSLSITNCNYGVRRIADDVSSPDRMTLLRSDLGAALGEAFAGKPIAVKHYGLYVNDAVGLRGGVYGNDRGLIVDWLKEKGVSCAPEKMNGGWFEFAEHTTQFAPVIAEITVEVDGRSVAARGLISPEKSFLMKAKDAYYGQLLFEAMRKATADLVRKLQAAPVQTSQN